MERRTNLWVVAGSSSPTLSTFWTGHASVLTNVVVHPFLPSWQIVDAVHKNGSFIFLQIAAIGRAATPDVLQEEGGYPLVAPSPLPIPAADKANTSPPPVPHALTVEEIGEYVQLFASAARNAVLRAGFDGVEIHGAYGYLVDQFLQTNSNERTDSYGGSVENRARFLFENIDAIVNAVGANRVGIRFSPWSTVQGVFERGFLPLFSFWFFNL